MEGEVAPEDYPTEGWMLLPDMNNFDGAMLINDFPADLASMQEMVQGLIEYVPLGPDRSFVMPLGIMGEVVDIIVNEEGLFHPEMSFNPVGTIIANGTRGWNGFDNGPFNLVGPVLVHFRTQGVQATLTDLRAQLSNDATVELDEMGRIRIESLDGDAVVEGDPNIHYARIAEASGVEFAECVECHTECVGRCCECSTPICGDPDYDDESCYFTPDNHGGDMVWCSECATHADEEE